MKKSMLDGTELTSTEFTDESAVFMVDSSSKNSASPIKKNTGPPPYLKRKSPFYIFTAIFMFVVIVIFCGSQLIHVTNRFHPLLKKELYPPSFPFNYLGSMGVDISDLQWYYFLLASPVSVSIMSVLILVTRQARRRGRPKQYQLLPEQSALPPSPNKGASSSSSNDHYLVGRDVSKLQTIHFIAGLVVSFVISGPPCVFGFLLVLANFYLIRPLLEKFSYKLSMTIMWVTHVAMIFLNFHFAGYSFRWFGLGWLDTAWPILIRWPIQYNMSLLRMIAFNSDYWEYYLLSKEGGGQAVVDKRKKVLQKHLFTCIECAQTRDRNNVSSINISGSMEESLLCYKARTECTRSGEEYKSLRSYLAYVYYAPLFVAGPMISYNAYESYCNFPLRNINRKEIIRYATRIFYNGVTLFVFMHFIHIHAIIVATPPSSSTSTTLPPISIGQRGRALPPHDPSQYEPIDETLSVMSQLNVTQRVLVFIFLLAFLWLKFNVIWKFFRLVSLVEGVDTPEDMPRCFANVVSIQGFWRDWHASFNHWIVRYMYIPMGGKNKKFLTIFPIFFFIAVWHDVELRLLFWALFICIVLVPEIIFTLLFASKRIPIINKIKSNFKLFFALRVIGTELTMMELVLINLVGFAIGADGVGEGIKTFYKIEVYFIYVVVFGFMAAAILSVQDRDEEQYNKYMLRQKYNLITNYHEKSVEK